MLFVEREIRSRETQVVAAKPRERTNTEMSASVSAGYQYSTFGRDLVAAERLGEPPCQHLRSRKMQPPALSGATVLQRIHRGSRSGWGGSSSSGPTRCDPGICRIGPLSVVRSSVLKLRVSPLTGPS